MSHPFAYPYHADLGNVAIAIQSYTPTIRILM